MALSFIQGAHSASCMYRLTETSTSRPTNVLQTLRDRTITECGLACSRVVECKFFAISRRKCVLIERYGRHGTTGSWNVYEKMCHEVQRNEKPIDSIDFPFVTTTTTSILTTSIPPTNKEEPTQTSTSSPITCPEINFDYSGNDIVHVANVESWTACARQCSQHNDCFAWSWLTPQWKNPPHWRKGCNLKSKKWSKGRKVLNNVISGDKSCLA